jgi:hypothetical protein
MASAFGCVELRARVEARPAGHYAAHFDVDRAHGKENPDKGIHPYSRALANLSHKVGRGTVANVLKRNGIESSPARSRRTPR